MDDLEGRLEAAKERTRKAREARELREQSRELEERVEAAEREAADAEAIEAAEVEHGAKRVMQIPTSSGVVIVKRPNPIHYKRFRDEGDANTEAIDRLVRPCVVYPSLSEFDRILEEEPAVLDRCADRVVRLAGFRVKELEGK